MRYHLTLALGALALAACSDYGYDAPVNPRVTPGDPPGAVYTLTNRPTGNELIVFRRAVDGTLTVVDTVPTGGIGTGAGLSSAGSLVLTEDNRFLLAVNAASDDISVFSLTPDPVVVDLVDSDGELPVSIAVRGRLVYVLNAGESHISGFNLGPDGQLTLIAGSRRELSGENAGGAQIAFSPDGRFLVVTERLTNVIDVFALNADGTASAAIPQESAGETPFGFDFSNDGTLVVSEAFGGAADASATSSYDLVNEGELLAITKSLGTTETAACWVVISNDGRFAYVANTGSSSVSGYAVAPDGSLTLLDEDGVTGETGGGGTDIAISANGQFLYVLAHTANAVTGFRRRADGTLEKVTTGGGLPSGAIGLVAR
ncbi:MAG TPA: beta-propeller fold lactonase family protein [Gemmatimonadaceae bacterium]|nr:beta-propeller fold lactonase family protein [Gemmatimonadaceae bacterium]